MAASSNRPLPFCRKCGSRDIVVSYIGGQFDAPQPYVFCPNCAANERHETELEAQRRRRIRWSLLIYVSCLATLALLPLPFTSSIIMIIYYYSSIAMVGLVILTVFAGVSALITRTPLNLVAWYFHQRADYEDIYSPRRYQPNNTVAARMSVIVYRIRDQVDTIRDFCFGWFLLVIAMAALAVSIGFGLSFLSRHNPEPPNNSFNRRP